MLSAVLCTSCWVTIIQFSMYNLRFWIIYLCLKFVCHFMTSFSQRSICDFALSYLSFFVCVVVKWNPNTRRLFLIILAPSRSVAQTIQTCKDVGIVTPKMSRCHSALFNDMNQLLPRGIVNSLPGCTKIPYFFFIFKIDFFVFPIPLLMGYFSFKNMGVYEYLFELTTPQLLQLIFHHLIASVCVSVKVWTCMTCSVCV